MANIQGALPRDANRVPIQNGLLVTKSLTLSANNTTANVPIFTVTGSVEIIGLYGVVTTALSSNITAAYLQINDQTATPDISLASGTTLSSFTVGSLVARTSVAGVAVVGANASAGRVTDPVAATAPSLLMPFGITQKDGGILTQIEFVYSTTNTPASGVIKWYARWFPLSDDGNIASV
jgi:hypothetical protein